MKRVITMILVLLMMVVVVGCTENYSTADDDGSAPKNYSVESVSLTINAFTMNGVEHKLILEDSNTGVTTQRVNTVTVTAHPGETVEEVLLNNGYFGFEVDEILDKFLGFMEYKVNIAENEDGTQTVTYEKISDTLYTVEKLLEKEVSDYSVTFIAKWKTLSDDYYAAFGY